MEGRHRLPDRKKGLLNSQMGSNKHGMITFEPINMLGSQWLVNVIIIILAVISCVVLGKSPDLSEPSGFTSIEGP